MRHAGGVSNDEAEPGMEQFAPSTVPIPLGPERSWARVAIIVAVSLIALIALGFAAGTVYEAMNVSPAEAAFDEVAEADDADAATVRSTLGGTVTANWSASLERVVLVARAMPGTAVGETYAAWFVRGEEAILAGTFTVGPDLDNIIALEGEYQDGDTVIVTVEQSERPTQPNGDPVAEIPTGDGR